LKGDENKKIMKNELKLLIENLEELRSQVEDNGEKTEGIRIGLEMAIVAIQNKIRTMNPNWCFFENRTCEHAEYNGKAFECKATNGDEMICIK